MHCVPLETLLALGWSDTMRHKLADLAIDPAVAAITASDINGRLTAKVWDAVPDPIPPGTIALWARQMPRRGSRTAEAVRMVLEDGIAASEAAQRVGVTYQAVYKALKDLRARPSPAPDGA